MDVTFLFAVLNSYRTTVTAKLEGSQRTTLPTATKRRGTRPYKSDGHSMLNFIRAPKPISCGAKTCIPPLLIFTTQPVPSQEEPRPRVR